MDNTFDPRPDAADVAQDQADDLPAMLTAPVSVEGPVRVQEMPSKNAGFLLRTAPQAKPFKILDHDGRRRRAVVAVQQGAASANSVTQAAAAATSAVLPVGAYMTGFDVDFGTAAAAVSGNVTVTGAAVGTLTYTATAGTNGGQLSIRFPTPLAPAAAGTPVQVNVPAIVGGSAYSVTAYGVGGSGVYVSGSSGEATPPYALYLSPGEQLVLTTTDEVWVRGELADTPVRVLNELWTL